MATASPARPTHARPDLALQFDLSLDDEERATPPSSPARRARHNSPTGSPVRPPRSRIDADDGLAPNSSRGDELSQLLESVPFTQLDDTEVSSDSSSESRLRGRVSDDDDDDGGDARDDDDEWFGGVSLTRHRSPTELKAPPKVAPPRPPTPSAADSCVRCERLLGENRRLRRLLDEVAFRSASEQIEARAMRRDSASSSSLERRSSAASQRRAWRLPSAGRASFSGRSRPSGQRARLRAEVKAHAVTAEYLWRKLGAAEKELAAARGDPVPEPAAHGWVDDFCDADAATRIDPAAVLERGRQPS